MTFGSSLIETPAIRISEKEPYGLSAGYQPYRLLVPLSQPRFHNSPHFPEEPKGEA